MPKSVLCFKKMLFPVLLLQFLKEKTTLNNDNK